MKMITLSTAKVLQRNYITGANLTILRQSTGGMSASNPIEQSIRIKLSEALDVRHLDVINESHMHNVPKCAETHFKVIVVSEKFVDVPLIKRHRLVNQLLAEELRNGVHALSIVAKTPDQWNAGDKIVESSPTCRGGFGK